MKTGILYLFVFLHISTATALSELYKLPVFVSHFIEHDKGGGFFTEMENFLVHHYGGHEKDEDWETDQKLPFMKIDFIQFDYVFSPIKMDTSVYLDKYISSKPTIFSKDIHLFSSYLNSIWHPPKQA